MIKIVKGDLLTTKTNLICHQVNPYGIMGAGVALQIKERFPKVYQEYKRYCKHEK